MYQVILTKRAAKGLERAPEHVRRRSVEVLDALRETLKTREITQDDGKREPRVVTSLEN